MEKVCKTYDKKIISEFVDNELSFEKHKLVSEHITTCPVCKNIFEKYLDLSDVLEQNTSTQLDNLNTSMIKQNVLKHIRKKETGLFKKVFDYFSPKFYIKAASVVTIFIISLVYFQTQHIKPTKAITPSAIVNSVDGSISSVMIFETEKSKHTIIWFSEA